MRLGSRKTNLGSSEGEEEPSTPHMVALCAVIQNEFWEKRRGNFFSMVFPPKLEKNHVKIDRHFSPKIREHGAMNSPNCQLGQVVAAAGDRNKEGDLLLLCTAIIMQKVLNLCANLSHPLLQACFYIQFSKIKPGTHF